MSYKVEKKEVVAEGIRLNIKTVLMISILAVVLVIAAGVLSHVIPQGAYTASQIVDNVEIFDPDSYVQFTDQEPLAWWKILLSPILALNPANDYFLTGIIIVVFIVVIGGTFLIVDECGVLKYIMGVVVEKFSNKKYFLLALIVFICMLLSSTAGILEEAITLVPIAVAISLALGWDSLVGLGMSLIAIAFGFTAATFNPFNVVTIQKMAGLEIYSGLGFRIIVFFVVYAILAAFLILYAKRIEKNPQKSLCYESDLQMRDKYPIDVCRQAMQNKKIAKASKAFCICLGCVFLLIALDFALGMGGTISSAAMPVMFAVGAVLAAVFSGMIKNDFFKNFSKGIKTILPILPFFVLILAIIYVLTEGQILPTILHYAYTHIQGLNSYICLLVIFFLIMALEFFIGSGSIKALLTMPVILPLANMLGITSQSVILSFCLGDGFTNLLYPTSGIMIIAIGMVGVTYKKWLKFSAPLFIAEFAASIVFMMLAISCNYS